MSLTQTEIAAVLGFAVLVGLGTLSLVTSWQTRRLMLAVFGENPGPAQLGSRGYYVRPPGLPPEPGPSPTPTAPRTPPAPATPPSSSRPGALAPAVEPPPASSGARALAPPVEPLPGSSHPPSVRPAAGRPAREPFKLPPLAPLSEYAEQARGPAPDAEEPDSTPGKAFQDPALPPPPAAAPAAPSPRRAVHPPPIQREEPELPKGDAPPDTWRKPGSEPSSRERPAVTAPVDRAKLVRDLDESDQAQSQQAPELRPVPTTRLPPSGQAPAASGAQVAVAPPASGSAQRPLTGREKRSAAPPPHAPPVKSTRPSMLGGLAGAPVERPTSDPARAAREHASARRAPPVPAPAPAGAPLVPARQLPPLTPPPPRAAQPSKPDGGVAARVARATGEDADGEETHMQVATLPKPNANEPRGDEFDSVDEVTKVAPAPVAQGAPAKRSLSATLASMPSVVPQSARPEPDVKIVEAPAIDDGARRAPAPVSQ
jgi:hypothetical protein